MKKVSTIDLVTWELESYLDGVLSCFDFCDGILDRFVTGGALDLLEKLPERERAYAIREAIAAPNYDCINFFPCPQGDNEFFLASTEFEIDITNIALENPDDFCIRKMGDCKLAYYALDYGAYIGLDLEKLEAYVTDFLADQENK